MATIPVDEVIAHLHGTGAEFQLSGPNSWEPTGGGLAALTVTRTDREKVVVTITFMFRKFEFEVSRKDWDDVFGRATP